MWCNPVKALAVVSVGLWSIPLVYAQGALSFDDRRAQLEAQTELVAKELALQDALRRLAAPRQAGLPTIVAIMGLEGKYTARLLQPNGVVSYFRENETIRPGMVISAITEKAVLVRVGQGKDSRAVALDFAAGASAAVGAVPGLPPGAPSGPLPPELLPPPPAVQVGPGRRTAPAAAPAQPAPSAQAPVVDPISQTNAAAAAATQKK